MIHKTGDLTDVAGIKFREMSERRRTKPGAEGSLLSIRVAEGSTRLRRQTKIT